MTRITSIAIAATMTAFSAQSIMANPVADFYTNRTITIIVGMNPPDQHDNDARLLARFMGQYIPGKPNFVVQNMPGAGSLKAVQYLVNVAPSDGSTFGIAQRGIMMMPLLGFKEADFDPSKFTWIGSRAPETSIVAIWHEVPIKSINDIMERETLVAATGGGADSNTLPFIYNETIGTKFKVVRGYQGGGPMNLAMERGEVEGRVGWSVGAMRGTKDDWFVDKKVNIVLQHGLKPNPVLESTPLAQDLAKNDDDRALLELFAARQGIGFPVFGPPGIPAERARALQDAYSEMVKDPDYIAEVKKMRVDLDPLTGQDMQDLINKIYAFESPVIERAKAILKSAGAIPQ